MTEKIILVGFMGRKDKMKILFHYLLKNKQYFDEFHIYAFTHVEEDLKFIRYLDILQNMVFILNIYQ